MAFSKILVPHDCSPSSDVALEYALRIAGGDQCEVVLMHVIPSYPTLAPGARAGGKGSGSYMHDLYEELETDADRILSGLKGGQSVKSPVSITTHIVVGGNVAERIVEYARAHQVDLIVINSKSTLGRGRAKLKFWVPIGSVSRAVSEMAPCPVLLVRPVVAR